MSKVVLDASAVLALLQNEKGAEKVASALPESVCSPVNYAEIVGKLLDAGMPEEAVHEVMENLKIDVIPLGKDDAYGIGALYPVTKALGLSLGDRACIALGRALKRPVLTADRAWSRASLPVEVRNVR